MSSIGRKPRLSRNQTTPRPPPLAGAPSRGEERLRNNNTACGNRRLVLVAPCLPLCGGSVTGQVTSANTSGINPLVAASNQCFGMRARGCLRCGAELRAATILLPFATLTASAPAFRSASRQLRLPRACAPVLCGGGAVPPLSPPVGAAPLRLACHKPPLRARVKPCAIAPLRSVSFVAVRLLLSCLVSRSLSFGGLQPALTPPLSRSPSAPPRCPPRPTFRRSSSLGGARSSASPSRACALPPPLALPRV
jgi:hypothetical protein